MAGIGLRLFACLMTLIVIFDFFLSFIDCLLVLLEVSSCRQ